MSRYHVNVNTGNTGVCKALKGACPFGGEDGDDNHYDSSNEAQNAAEKIMDEQYKTIKSAYRKKDTSSLIDMNVEMKKRIISEAVSGVNGLHPSVVAKVFSKDNNELIREKVSRNFKSQKILREMSNDESAKVRLEVAKATNNPEVLKSFANDPDINVRRAASENKKMPAKNLKEVLASLDIKNTENDNVKKKQVIKKEPKIRPTEITTSSIIRKKPSPLTEKEFKTFSDGDCWVLAKELHDRNIGTLVGVAPENDPEAYNHMAIKLPNGDIVDANGVQSEKDFYNTWSPHAFGKPGTAKIVDYPIKTKKDWDNLTSDMEDERISTDSELKMVADKIQEWGNLK